MSQTFKLVSTFERAYACIGWCFCCVSSFNYFIFICCVYCENVYMCILCVCELYLLCIVRMCMMCVMCGLCLLYIVKMCICVCCVCELCLGFWIKVYAFSCVSHLVPVGSRMQAFTIFVVYCVGVTGIFSKAPLKSENVSYLSINDILHFLMWSGSTTLSPHSPPPTLAVVV